MNDTIDDKIRAACIMDSRFVPLFVKLMATTVTADAAPPTPTAPTGEMLAWLDRRIKAYSEYSDVLKEFRELIDSKRIEVEAHN